ncbi:MAG: hypothetical protein M5R38_01940 [Candidatus Methylomirabilis sp.]|nr:hypothetical protein [Candidatus Methylomirabilis sp.]
MDEYREIAYLVTADGIRFVSLKHGAAPSPIVPKGLNGARIVGISSLGRGPFALGLSDGRVMPAEIRFTASFPDGQRQVDAEFLEGDPIRVDPDTRPILRLAHVVAPTGPITAAAVGSKEVVLVTVTATNALIGPSTKEESRQRFSLPIDGEITALALDGRGENLFVGTSSGQVLRAALQDSITVTVAETIAAASRPGTGVNIMGLLIGDRTLVVGDASGGVSSWQLLRSNGGEQRLTRIYEFDSHSRPVVAFAPSGRDKGFITADASGTSHLYYGTTGKPCSRSKLKRAAPKRSPLPLKPMASSPLIRPDGWRTGPSRTRILKLPGRPCSARSGMKGIPLRSTSGNPRVEPMTLKRSSA